MSEKQWSFGRGRGHLSLCSGMVVGGLAGAWRLVGAKGQMSATWGGGGAHHLTGLISYFDFDFPYRLPVHSAPEVRGNVIFMSLSQ